MAFAIGRFCFRLQVATPVKLPLYQGSTLRGAFGQAFKKTVCVVGHGRCERCLIRQSCVYPYIFETPPPPGTEMMRKYTHAPHPFVLEPPEEGLRLYESGETLAFGLVLLGRALELLPYFIYTFDRLGGEGLGPGRGRFRLAGVTQETPEGSWMPVYDGKTQTLTEVEPTLDGLKLLARPEPVEQVTLVFQTPTRIKWAGRLTAEPDFQVLLRNLLRRISLLVYFHGGERLELDFRGLIEQAQAVTVTASDLRWYDWERYSGRQKTRMRLGGFTGTLTCQGRLEAFMPYLRLGTYVHLGKGTSFGLGRYEIRSAD